MTGNRRSGFTLIEMSISVVILVVLLGGAALVVRSGETAFRESVSTSRVNGETNRAMNRIARFLTGAGRTTLFPAPVAPFSTEEISFQELTGYVGGTPTWSSDMAVRLEYEGGELDNDLDDDGDGFVDECQVVQVLNVGEADERSIVLIKSVREFLEGEEPDGVDENGNGLEDERGLCFELDGRELIIRLSVMRRAPNGTASTRTLETSVALRN